LVSPTNSISSNSDALAVAISHLATSTLDLNMIKTLRIRHDGTAQRIYNKSKADLTRSINSCISTGGVIIQFDTETIELDALLRAASLINELIQQHQDL